MKKPMFFLIAATMAASLGGCGPSATAPGAAESATPPSKPNPWSIGGGATPSASASATPTASPKPAGSDSPKANPWGMAAPKPVASPVN